MPNDDPSTMFDNFYTIISDIVDRRIPVKRYQENN